MGNEMKVLSYLDFMLSEGNSKIPDAIMDGYTEFAELYSLPFKPEMITELFEGFEEYTGIHDLYYNDSKCQEIRFNKDNKHVYELFQDSLSRPIVFYRPRTLDDFINDATRTGIELEWKLQ